MLPGQETHDFSLLQHFPQPLCIANSSGKVLLLNRQWESLHSGAFCIATLSEFDRLTGTRLAGRLTHSIGHRTFSIKLQDTSYSAVTWPIDTLLASKSIALVLFPQQLQQARDQEYPRLERELLVGAQAVISKAKQALGQNQVAESQGLLTELAGVVGYVAARHTALRTKQPVQSVEVAAVWRSVLPLFRSGLRQQGILVTSTLSHHSQAVAAKEDLHLFFTTLLEYIQDGDRGTAVRIHQEPQMNVQLITVETDSLPADTHLQRIRLRLLYQLAAKMGGTLQASGAPHPRYRLTLRSPIPEG